MLEMSKKDILPAASKYANKLAETIGLKKAACGMVFTKVIDCYSSFTEEL